MSRILALLAAAALLIAVAGCGSSSSSSTSSTSAATTSAAPAAGGGPAVTMQNIAFAPPVVSVKVGQAVTWTNQDSVEHNVTATKGATFKSSTFGKGGTFSWKADKAGTVAYVCTIHPGMEGKIIVSG